MFCKHRVRILCGGVDGIVSDNHADVIMLSEWLRGTDVETALQAVVSLEREADRIKEP